LLIVFLSFFKDLKQSYLDTLILPDWPWPIVMILDGHNAIAAMPIDDSGVEAIIKSPAQRSCGSDAASSVPNDCSPVSIVDNLEYSPIDKRAGESPGTTTFA
jgi:hypothetical protein